MSENKEIRFKFVVDEQAAQRAKAVITDLIQSATQLARVFQGSGMGGGFGLPGARGAGGLQPSPWLSGSVGGAASGQQLISQAASRPGGQQAGGITSIFLQGADSLKNFANMSTGAMRMLSDNVRRAVDEQKRSLASLDDELEKVAKRYNQLKDLQGAGGPPMLPAESQHLASEGVRLAGERDKARAGLQTLQGQQEALNKAMNPGAEGGGGAKIPWKAIGGAALFGIDALTSDYLKRPFDYTNLEARQAQTFKVAGVSTRRGDLRYMMALQDILHDTNKAAEFGQIGNTTSTVAAATQVTLAPLKSLLSLQLGEGLEKVNPLALERAYKAIPTEQKGNLLELIKTQMQTDPERYEWMWNKFQSESPTRMRQMARVGYDKGYGSLREEAAGAYGFGEGEIGGAFEAIRGGGRSGSGKAHWMAMRVMAQGGNVNVAGDLIIAAGGAAGLVPQAQAGLDIVAGENIMKGVTTALEGSTFGLNAAGGFQLASAMKFGLSSDPQQQAYETRQRAAAMPGFGGFLGGVDPMGKALGILTAAQIVGPGGDLYQMQAITELMNDPAAMAGLLAGKTTPQTEAAGFTPEMARKAFTRLGSDFVARNIHQPGARLMPSSVAMERLTSVYGGNLQSMFETEGVTQAHQRKLVTELGLATHLMGLAPTAQAGEAYIANAVGMATGPYGPDKRPGPGIVGYGSTESEATRARMKEEEKTYNETRGDWHDAIKAMSTDLRGLGKVMASVGELSVGAKEATISLLSLAEAADELRKSQGLKPIHPEGELRKLMAKNHNEIEKRVAKGDEVAKVAEGSKKDIEPKAKW